jgi:hypothetical protein
VTADYRLTAFSVDRTEVRRIALDRGWLGALFTKGVEMRTADVGAPMDVTVVALTQVELARVNEVARARANAEEEGEPFDHLRANTLQCCDEVNAVIRWAGAQCYFSPWFVIESADID